MEDRFWSKVRRGSEYDCWEWSASKDSAGYGEFHLRGKTTKAHRISFSLANPSVAIDGLCVLHRCDNPGCVNPAHLFAGTHQDNVADRVAKGRGRFSPHLGEKNGSSKLTDLAVVQIRALRGSMTQKEIAKLYGVTQATVSLIQLHMGWNHVR